MNANGKKTGFRVAVMFAVAGATVAMAGPSSSEGVALDQVVLVNKDAPSQQSGGNGGGERSLFDGSLFGEGSLFDGSLFGGDVVGGGIANGDNILGGNINGGVTGSGSILGNTNGNSLGNTNGNQTGD